MNDALPRDAAALPASVAAASPMMAQYHEIKTANPGYLLFYRMGDFYELFFDDAVQAAPALDIALTKRGFHQGKNSIGVVQTPSQFSERPDIYVHPDSPQICRQPCAEAGSIYLITKRIVSEVLK